MSVAGYIIVKEGTGLGKSVKIYKSTDATSTGSTWSEVHENSDTLGDLGLADIYVKSDTEIYYAVYTDNVTPEVKVYKSTNSGSSFTLQISINVSTANVLRIVGSGTHIVVVYDNESFIHTTDGSNWSERDLSSSGLNQGFASGTDRTNRNVIDAAVLSSTQAVLLQKASNSSSTLYCTLIYLTAADSSNASNYTTDDADGIEFNSSGDFDTSGALRVVGYSTSAMYVVGKIGSGTGIFKSTGLTAGSLSSTHGFGTTDTINYKSGTFVPSGAIYFTGGTSNSKHVYYYSDQQQIE